MSKIIFQVDDVLDLIEDVTIEAAGPLEVEHARRLMAKFIALDWVKGLLAIATPVKPDPAPADQFTAPLKPILDNAAKYRKWLTARRRFEEKIREAFHVPGLYYDPRGDRDPRYPSGPREEDDR